MNQQQKQNIRTILRIAAITGNSLLATLLLVSAYGGMINPYATPAGAIAAMTFPIMLLLTVAVTVVNLMWMRKMAIINGLSLLLCAGPILTFCPLNLFRPSEESLLKSDEPTLKVLTYNIFNLYDFSAGIKPGGDTTVEYIIKENADIVFCQESAGLTEADNELLSENVRKKLLEMYPYVTSDERGMTLLSKYPFKEVSVDFADKAHLDLCRYDVDVNGETIHLFNVHMQSIGLTSHDKELYRQITEGEASGEMDEIRHGLIAKLSAAFRSRASQAEDVRKAIEATDGTVLLCGDFNDIPGSYAYRVIAGNDMTDAYREAGLGPAITYHADRLYFRIDQILYRGNLEALRTWTGDCESSDHYPMLCIFRLGKH